jgi:putative aldouronate transport system permease protein
LAAERSGRGPARRQTSEWEVIKRDLVVNRYVYLMLVPVVSYYLLFHYGPLYGAQIAFKDFSPGRGIFGSPWIGFTNFVDYFHNIYFWRLIRNTLLINILNLVFGFPAPIILALLLNEVRMRLFKRVVQTITYMPHFISIIVISGMLVTFLGRDGLINNLLAIVGVERTNYLLEPRWFRAIYVASDIWQHAGWGTIVYLAALSAIDPQLYEAAVIDGAGRWKQMLHITLPGIAATIIILFILRLGAMMNLGSEKILLLYNANTYETADVISTFVYRKGILETSFSFSAAVGLFNSFINFAILLSANRISRYVSGTSLW